VLNYVPKYYNKVTLIMDGGVLSTHYAANASITTDELNRGFVDTGRQLQPLKMPVVYFGEYSIGSYIESNLIKAIPKYT